MSNDLAQWLRGRLDEDEQTALTWPADQRNWDEYGDRRLDYASGVGEEVSAVNVKANAPLGWERIYVKRDGIGLSLHIVRHDPARVLREIDAKRQIIDLHSGAHRCPAFDQYPGGPRFVDPEPQQRTAPCTTLRLLALPYADRSGYREEWRP